MLQQEIKTFLRKAIKKKFETAPIPEVEIEIPENPEHGDYATNAALVLAKILKKNPMEVARELESEIGNQELWTLEIAPPGFINFKLTLRVFIKELSKILQEGENYGNLRDLKDKKVVVEFTDPNPFKEFHIGHLYTNIVGETLCRIFEMRGAIVRRVNYQGDVGLHVAKAIWGMQR